MLHRWPVWPSRAVRRAIAPACLALSLAGAVTGCGGGAAEGEPAAPRETPLELVQSGEAARQFALIYASSLMSLSEQLAVWLHQAAAQGWPGSPQSCPDGGERTLHLDDRDGSGSASVGDAISVSLSGCHVPMAMNVYSGAVNITLTEYEPGARLAGSAEFQSGGLSFPAGEVAAHWGGTVLLRHRQHAEGSIVRSVQLQSAAGPVTLSLSLAGVTLTEELRALSVLHEVRRDTAGNRTSMQFVLASEALGGVVEVSTPEPFVSYLDTYPHRGILRVTGAAGQRVELRHGAGGATGGRRSFVNGVPATFAQADTAVPWIDYDSGYLWWSTGEAPAAFQAIRPLAQTRFDATVPGGAVAPAAAFAVQLSRPLVSGTSFVARLARLPGTAQQSDWGSGDVPADVQVDGALLMVQPAEQLQPGRRYMLSFPDPSLVSERGETGIPPVEVLVRDTVTAAIDVAQPAVLLPGRTLQLVARATSTSTVDPVASVQWSQGEGPALRFTTASDGAVLVDLPGGPVGPPVDVPVTLTVATASGVADRFTLPLRVVRAPSEAMMIHLHSPGVDPLLHGRTAIVSATAEGYAMWQPEFAFLSNRAPMLGTHDLAAYFALPAGSPLQPGRYVGAVLASQRTVGPGMDLWFPSHVCNSIQGEFTLLEAQAGTLTYDGYELNRLAVDFELSCDGRSPVHGSIRWHSDIPLRLLPMP